MHECWSFFIFSMDAWGLLHCQKLCIPVLHPDALCLTMWVENAATLHGAILSQFPQLPHAENEQSTDKMQKCIVDCVVYLLYDCIQWKSCRLSAGNQLTWFTFHKYSPMILMVMHSVYSTISSPDSVFQFCCLFIRPLELSLAVSVSHICIIDLLKPG